MVSQSLQYCSLITLIREKQYEVKNKHNQPLIDLMDNNQWQ